MKTTERALFTSNGFFSLGYMYHLFSLQHIDQEHITLPLLDNTLFVNKQKKNKHILKLGIQIFISRHRSIGRAQLGILFPEKSIG